MKEYEQVIITENLTDRSLDNHSDANMLKMFVEAYTRWRWRFNELTNLCLEENSLLPRAVAGSNVPTTSSLEKHGVSITIVQGIQEAGWTSSPIKCSADSSE